MEEQLCAGKNWQYERGLVGHCSLQNTAQKNETAIDRGRSKGVHGQQSPEDTYRSAEVIAGVHFQCLLLIAQRQYCARLVLLSHQR